MAATSSQRLLVLPCSARKRAERRKLAAIERYDGPAYQSLRKLMQQGKFPTDVVLRIVSAKYGLLSPTDSIGNYDRRLDPDRDDVLIASTRARLVSLANALVPHAVLSLLGNDYARCLPSSWPGNVRTKHVSGPPGKRVRTMLDWLKEPRCF